MMIHEVTQLVERYKSRKRVGRGHGSGHGKTSGRGHKGAKSRSGWSTKLAREGGQLAYFRRIPKRGFSNSVFRNEFHIINISDLQAHFKNGDTVNAEALVAKGLVRDTGLPVKVLGDGELSHKLTVQAGKASGAAREKIERAGGSLELSMRQPWSRSTAASSKSENAASNSGKKKSGSKKES